MQLLPPGSTARFRASGRHQDATARGPPSTLRGSQQRLPQLSERNVLTNRLLQRGILVIRREDTGVIALRRCCQTRIRGDPRVYLRRRARTGKRAVHHERRDPLRGGRERPGHRVTGFVVVVMAAVAVRGADGAARDDEGFWS